MENEGKFLVTEYCNGVTDISFRLPSHGWEKLEKSECWDQVCQFLAEVDNPPIERVILLKNDHSGQGIDGGGSFLDRHPNFLYVLSMVISVIALTASCTK